MIGPVTLRAGLAAAAILGAGAGAAQQAQPQAQQGRAAPAWLATCTNTGEGGALECEIAQSIVVQATGARVMTVTLRTSPPAAPVLALTLPHGMFLPAGVRIAVDGEAGPAEAVRTCDANGCYLGREMDAAALERLLAGRELSVTFQDLQQRDISLTLGLEGLADAYRRAAP